MRTVLRAAGLRFVIYPGDHRPAHVHDIGQGGEAVFNLNCRRGVPLLREVYGLSRSDTARIQALVVTNKSVLCAAWESIHGEA